MITERSMVDVVSLIVPQECERNKQESFFMYKLKVIILKKKPKVFRDKDRSGTQE